MNINNTNKQLYRLEDKKQAQPHTTCSACEKPVEHWDQYGESQIDYGMKIWECCPHCGEASNDHSGAWTMVGIVVLVLAILFFILQMSGDYPHSSKHRLEVGTNAQSER